MNQLEMSLNLPEVKGVVESLPSKPAEVRLRKPIRNQVEMILRDLDSMVAEDHPVRAIWDFLQRLDVTDFYSSIRALLDSPGRPASDPRVLLALWVYATVDDV